MDEFRLQRSVCRDVLKFRGSFGEAVSLMLARLAEAPGGKPWASVGGIDWSHGLDRWVAWLRALVLMNPPPASTKLLWFEAPSELNPALTSVSAYDGVAPPPEYIPDDDRTWPNDESRRTQNAALHPLIELEEAWRQVGWRRKLDSIQRSALMPSIHASSAAYAALLVRHGLPRVDLMAASPKEQGLAIVTGWAGGGELAIGQHTASGWKPIIKVKRDDSVATKSELDPESGGLNVRKYLAAGGDPNWRDDRLGMTLLMHIKYKSAEDVRLLIEAGADVRAVDKQGWGVLHHFGAAEFDVLQPLFEAGAPVDLVNKRGWQVLDRVVDDGRCTVEHIEYYTRAGARLGGMFTGGFTPLHSLGSSGQWNRSMIRQWHAMARYWVDKGFDVNSRAADGMTPLWKALQAHLRDLTDAYYWFKQNKDAGPREIRNRRCVDRSAIGLLELGADPNDVYAGPPNKLIVPGSTPLMARVYESDKLARVLLKHGADPTRTCAAGRTAAWYARRAASNPDRYGFAAREVAALLERRAAAWNPTRRRA